MRYRITYEWENGETIIDEYGSELAVVAMLIRDGGSWQYRKIIIEPIKEEDAT